MDRSTVTARAGRTGAMPSGTVRSRVHARPGRTRHRVALRAPRLQTAPVAEPVVQVVRTGRLTRRGRAVVLLALVGLLFAAFSLGRAATQAATSAEPAPAVVQTTVLPGDSLWSVARRVAPGADPREVVDQLRRMNHLRSSTLQAGQQLLLPA